MGAMAVLSRVAKNIDAYIAGQTAEVQPILAKVRATILKAAPGAEEAISYKIPAFKLDGRYVIYFAAFKKHVGLYPSPLSHPDFAEALAPHASGKASARFSYDLPIPVGLITKIVKFRVRDNRERAKAKGAKKR
jgi:uncharacterized protein YdhG (YjbR/CyaY superfamily)